MVICASWHRRLAMAEYSGLDAYWWSDTLANRPILCTRIDIAERICGLGIHNHSASIETSAGFSCLILLSEKEDVPVGTEIWYRR